MATTIRCVCGTTLTDDSIDALRAQMRAHGAEVHGEFPMTEDQFEDFFATCLRQVPLTPRLDPPPVLVIEPLTPDRAADYLHFFDHHAFVDNPIWGGCYCVAYHCGTRTNQEWVARRHAENRAFAAERIADGAHQGFLAYDGDHVVGWCNGNRRSAYTALPDGITNPNDPSGSIGTIICFVIGEPYRRQGLATRLLDATLDRFRVWGLREAEAFPVKESARDAGNFHGPLALYEAAGFTIAAELPAQYRVVKRLTP
ncbi:MAG: GNAT family N-acetyltransferase [bacterium]